MASLIPIERVMGPHPRRFRKQFAFLPCMKCSRISSTMRESRALKTLERPEIKESESLPSHFSFAITKVAVSQICQYVGFRGSKTSALQTLTNIATIYLKTLARTAASFATSSGRTDSNLLDVIYALEDLTSVHGFRGATNVNLPLLSSATIIDIMNFVKFNDEIPFAKPIPRNNTRSRSYNGDVYDRNIKHKSIPRWLPPFPDPITYELREEIKSSNSIYRSNSLKRLGSPPKSALDVEQNVQFVKELSTNEISPNANRKEDERKRKYDSELPLERERMRFKMIVGGGRGVGMDLRNADCNGDDGKFKKEVSRGFLK